MRVEGLVSTIIPVFNRPTLLVEAVESVLTQTYRAIEIIIVDDGSTDGTAAVADRLQEQHRDIVRVIHQPNGGVAAARETGRLALRGEFVQMLDSDDVLLPQKFEYQVRGLRERPECGVSYGWTYFRSPDGTLSSRPSKRTGEQIETMFPAMLQTRFWETVTPLYRTALFDAAGPWSTAASEDDWEYDCRIAALGVRLHYCPAWLGEYRYHANIDHFSFHEASDPVKLRGRSAAHALIYEHARRAGIDTETPEMRHFARELFLLSRQCGAAGLAAESQRLFELAREASGARGASLQFRLYRAAARLLGWSRTGALACFSDRFR